jgi:hypothetical protein
MSMKPLSLLFFIAFMSAGARSEASNPADSLQRLMGRRFRCDEPSWALLCLNVMAEECRISIVPGRGLPREANDRAVVVRRDEARMLNGPDALIGCVTINSEEEALELLRFFSSYSTVYLFQEKMLEIFPSADPQCFAICFSSERWRKLGFQEPVVRKVEGGFEVSRTVIKPTPKIPEVEAFRLVQRVARNGQVSEVSRQPIDLPEDLRLLLSFPSFL